VILNLIHSFQWSDIVPSHAANIESGGATHQSKLYYYVVATRNSQHPHNYGFTTLQTTQGRIKRTTFWVLPFYKILTHTRQRSVNGYCGSTSTLVHLHTDSYLFRLFHRHTTLSIPARGAPFSYCSRLSQASRIPQSARMGGSWSQRSCFLARTCPRGQTRRSRVSDSSMRRRSRYRRTLP
jgi:hypothetical protein